MAGLFDITEEHTNQEQGKPYPSVVSCVAGHCQGFCMPRLWPRVKLCKLLMAGASICVPNEREYDFTNLASWIDKSCVSVLNITPSLAEIVLLNKTALHSVKLAFLCGEPLTQQRAEKILRSSDNIALINLYGATESCRALSYFEVTRDYLNNYKQQGNIPLGQGVEGVELFVLDKHGKRCGSGELGQIAIHAQHMTLGYLNDPELTSEKFIESHSKKGRLYLTGDYGRYDLQGNVHFSGRNDIQVKIRGFRVEPAEIEEDF